MPEFEGRCNRKDGRIEQYDNAQCQSIILRPILEGTYFRLRREEQLRISMAVASSRTCYHSV